MKRSGLLLALLPLLGAGCDALLGDNPNNCRINPDACTRDEFCNSDTARCETLDCTINTDLCQKNEYCDQSTYRCAPINCMVDPTICASSQLCNMTTRLCETKTFVLGQPDATSNLNAAYGMNVPWSVTLVPLTGQPGHSRLVVTDGGNGRTLIWNDVPTQNRPADAVLGLQDVNTLSVTGTYDGINELAMSIPWSATYNGDRLIIGDYGLNRILSWSPIPSLPGITEPTAATSVWGQPSFETGAVNAGQSMVNALGASSPFAFAEPQIGGRFFISDYLNNRVLAFDSVPTNSGQMPDVVLGQVDFVSRTPTLGNSGLQAPRGLFSDTAHLFVADGEHNRVLVFDLPLAAGVNNPAATGVYGQGSFTTNTAAATAIGLSVPSGVWVGATGATGTHVFIADDSNHRVLRYPGSGSTTADLVLGQANFTNNAVNRGLPCAADSLAYPTSVSSDGTHLVVGDYYNNRVLIWQTMPTALGQAADLALGQPDLSTCTVNTPPSYSGLQFTHPNAVATDGTHLAIADSGNNRVLLWQSIPTGGSVAPDVVIGQSDFKSIAGNTGRATPTGATLSNPLGVSIENGQLAIADTGNNRVLLFKQLPTQSAATADVVIGQSSATANAPAAGNSGLDQPIGALLHGGKLYVADTGNNRVLVFDDPNNNGLASHVLGQPNFTSSGGNYGGLSAHSLAGPEACFIDSDRLLVADYDNHRVLIWNTTSFSDFQAADVVVGQQDFTSSYTRLDRDRLSQPDGLVVLNGRLYVSSYQHNRILYWNQVPLMNGARPDGVLGQPSFTSAIPNEPDLMPTERVSGPAGLAAFGDQLFIADSFNNRVVVRGPPAQ